MNNPVMMVDPDGHAPKWLGWALTGLVLVGLTVLTICTFGAAAPITGVAPTMIIGATLGAYVGFGASIISQSITSDSINPWQVLFDTGMGAVTGLIGGSGIGMAGSMIAGGVLGFGGSVAGDAISGKPINWGKAALMGVIGVGLGAWTGAGAGNTEVMNASVNAGKSCFSKNFLNFAVSVSDDAAKYGLRVMASQYFANAIFGYILQSTLKVATASIASYSLGTILGEVW